MADCVQCGSPIPPRPPGTRGRRPIVCSAACRSNRARSTPRTDEQRAASAARMRELRCEHQTGSESRRPRAAPRSDGLCAECLTRPARRRFCSKVCATRAANRSETARVVAANRDLGADRHCAGCSTIFRATRSSRLRYCSSDCREVARERARPVYLPLQECPACEQPFQPCKRNQRTCSERCARRAWKVANPEVEAARSARVRGATELELIDRTDIFERDRWKCHLCEKKIDRRLKHPQAMSASLDHIVPLARGGEHTAANVAASHLRCNLRKQARGSGEQLAMI